MSERKLCCRIEAEPGQLCLACELQARIAELEAELAQYRAERDETPVDAEWLQKRGCLLYGDGHWEIGERGNVVHGTCWRDEPRENRIYMSWGCLPSTKGNFLTACRVLGVKLEVGQ